MKNKRKKKMLMLPIFLVVFAGATAIVMLLWNWLMPAIFGLGVISFWQSLGLIVLSRLLLGGFGKMGPKAPGCGPRRMKQHPFADRTPEEMFAMREKFRKMSREERDEYIRNKMDDRDRVWKDNNGEKAPEGCCEG